MSETPIPVPPDDPERSLTVARTDDADAQHIGMVGDAYTILVSGAQTNGQYCLIDMNVPPCGGTATNCASSDL